MGSFSVFCRDDSASVVISVQVDLDQANLYEEKIHEASRDLQAFPNHESKGFASRKTC